MTVSKKIKLVICWHMHQPHYRDGLDGKYRLPWVYLHGIKDYSDMVAHLENCPEARVVVNFAPVLLEQIDDYAQKMRAWLKDPQQSMTDPLLDWVSGHREIKRNIKIRHEILEACQKAFAPTMIDPFPAFKKLLDMAHCGKKTTLAESGYLSYFSRQYYIDLLMWYHLAWMGQDLRLTDSRVQSLIAKGTQGINFTPQDQVMLIEIMADTMEGLIPRYRKLMEAGQIEISMTPYGHPIVPLLIDFESTKDAMPHAPMPLSLEYPDGFERSKWHMEKGFEVYKQYFGTKPKGAWLSEGAISASAVGLLDEYEIQWTASGEGVWRHSCEVSHPNHHEQCCKKELHQPFQHATQKCAMFFRDDGLSDLIGFQYKDWHATDAANNFAHHLHNIADSLGDKVDEHVVSVILDGENAWEYYPDNAHHFLKAFYKRLSSDPRIEMTTYADVLAQKVPVKHLPVLKAGSWVYGSFSTWIGEKDKNRGWDLLVHAKMSYDEVMASAALTQTERVLATEQLAICEGSDWFWWFGDYNPAGSVKDFDMLYRRHLEKLYQIIGREVPEELQTVLSIGGGDMDNGGVMQRGVN